MNPVGGGYAATVSADRAAPGYEAAPPASRVAARSLTRRACGPPLTPQPLRPLPHNGTGRAKALARPNARRSAARSLKVRSLRFQGIAKGSELPAWQQELNTVHKRVRARVEHALCQMRWWNILRNCRRTGDGVYYATAGVDLICNLAVTG